MQQIFWYFSPCFYLLKRAFLSDCMSLCEDITGFDSCGWFTIFFSRLFPHFSLSFPLFFSLKPACSWDNAWEVTSHINSSNQSPFATFPFWGKHYRQGGGILFVHFLMVWGRFRFTIFIHLALWLKRLGFRWIFSSDMKTQIRRGEGLVFGVWLCFVRVFLTSQKRCQPSPLFIQLLNSHQE